MGNMSYCRFENTYHDLEDCYNSLNNEQSIDELSKSEKKYAIKLIKMCNDISEEYLEEIEDNND